MEVYPLVSILIPLYNAEKYFSETMESLLAQTYKNIEIIIVNDGSTDKSLQIAKNYENSYKHIKVYTQKNSGAPTARNKAFKMSNGKYIQYFDADDLMSYNKIENQMNAFREHNFDPDISSTCLWGYFEQDISTFRAREQITNRSYHDPLQLLIDSWENREYYIGQIWLFSRKLHLRIGSWDESLLKNQDGEFFTRVAYASKQTVFVYESIVYYRRDNEHSISKTIQDKNLLSEVKAYHSYCNIVKSKLEKKDVRRALVILYSKIIEEHYPEHKLTVKEAHFKIKELGYDEPLIEFSYKYKWGVKIFGVCRTLKLRRWKRLVALLLKKYT